MNKSIISFLKNYSFDPSNIDRLIVSSFLKERKLISVSSFLKDYIISEEDKDYPVFVTFSKIAKLNSLEKVIEAFEFVVSPKDKVVTGAVYTPIYIREYITRSILVKQKDNLENVLIADISCGCGGFLITAAQILHQRTRKTYKSIIKTNIWGLDIAAYSIIRSKIMLTLLALENGENVPLEFNLYEGNALNYEWEQSAIVKNNGFDVIVGNPPYVASRNIDEASKLLLDNWKVTKTGHPDLYIPFFQIGMTSLRNEGVLGFITVNTFFKSVNGRALREYFSEQGFDFSIIDFRGEQVFKKKNTYTCICFIKKNKSGSLKYVKTDSKRINQLKQSDFTFHEYNNFDDFNGWSLGDANTLTTVQKLEQFPRKLLDDFSFSTGIATLKNSIYKFKNVKTVGEYFTLDDKGSTFLIEKKLCREIINANKVTTEDEIVNLKQKLIFPYSYNKDTKKYEVIPEPQFKIDFPKAYHYLNQKATDLSKRDKGEGEYETWYAYGRNQGLSVEGIKLFLPHITDNPHFVICNDRKLMFCNGLAILSTSERKLLILKRILETPIFWYYILKTSKPYSSGFFSLSKNYIKSFSIPFFNSEEEEILLKEKNDPQVLSFLIRKYGISKGDIQV
jgi:adenine-specific DNA-methyltransferase